ncbi:MAG: hypothetical protein IPP36_07645 [Nitrosomonadales bacterium]|nr:hypothetical protein [Nitrosomonadales bacterium]
MIDDPDSIRKRRLNGMPTMWSVIAGRQQAEKFCPALRERPAYDLTPHPEKTRLVYCKDGRRREEHLHTKFDFSGVQLSRSDDAQNREGQLFTGFSLR